MHPRTGLDTAYLSDEFMEAVKACTQKAKEEGMFSYLYDEDRYASGFAGGFATQKPKNRMKHLLITKNQIPTVDKETGIETGEAYELCRFSVTCENNKLISYTKESTDSDKSDLWYVYVRTATPSGWFNNQTYADMLSEETVSDFIDITYPPYENTVGEYMGDTVTLMFSDEPHFGTVFLPSGDKDKILPWTTDFDDTFKTEFGYSIIDKLPEICWERADGDVLVQYRYFKHITDRFTNTFCRLCHERCISDDIDYTAHLFSEENLFLQARSIGDAMRAYKYMDIPGIDMLGNHVELLTAKQTQSAVHQYSKEGMMSEECGVTGWDFDFRGHKFHADWQAALGVTQRVLHLSWVSMKGSAKRDYPASISYQSPWYKEFSYIEDHISRVNTVLTRGKAIVNIGVIHPIESMWTMIGRDDDLNRKITSAEQSIDSVINGLLSNHLDFDLINEGLLPEQYENSSDRKLHVGDMAYSAIIIPPLSTMRRTTLDILDEYAKNGGKVIFIGAYPSLIDGEKCEDARTLFENSINVSSVSDNLYEQLNDLRTVEISNDNGTVADNLIYCERQDGSDKYIFIANIKYDETPDIVKPQNILIRIKGEQTPILLNTLTGEEEELEYAYENGWTLINKTIYSTDSLLLKLNNEEKKPFAPSLEKACVETVDFRGQVNYSREEDNVLVLDMAQWSTDDGKTFNETEEILRINKEIKNKYGFPNYSGEGTQPWAVKDRKIHLHPILKFTFDSEIETNVRLAFEEAEEIYLNGEKAEIDINGYFTDISIHTIDLPKIRKGTNELIVKVPVGNIASLENMFILGDFDVKLCGTKATICPPSKEIGFGSIVHQGMPFYGGNLTYSAEFEAEESGDVQVTIYHYRGALLEVSVDGGEYQKLAFAPYKINMGYLEKGRHTISI
ncbi:MAG: glycosyl hydrolase [Clostridiales bacterium]|nr:glycosyl hydrolase [Clostridiales bacterium]